MTPKEVAKKHYPDCRFDDCKMSCMQCDDGVCISQVKALDSLEEDIIKCIETFNNRQK